MTVIIFEYFLNLYIEILKSQPLDLRIAKYQFSILIITKLGFMKLLIFDPDKSMLVQQYCNLDKNIIQSKRIRSKIVTATEMGFIYIHEIRNFTAICLIKTIWNDVCHFIISADDIIFGH